MANIGGFCSGQGSPTPVAQQGGKSARGSEEGVTGKLCHRHKNLALSMNFLIETLCTVLWYYLAQVHFGTIKLLAQLYGGLNRHLWAYLRT